MSTDKYNVIIADDHSVLRQALCESLESRGKYHVIAQASDGEQLLNLLSDHKPDVLIMDVSMPRLDGLSALERMNPQHKGLPVLILSADHSERSARAALRAGARGFMPKHASIEELTFALDALLDGKTYVSPEITAALLNSSDKEQSPFDVLTKRELEVLKHLAEGLPNRQIGKLLHISTRTVDTHRSNILKKLNVHTNAELVKLAISHRIVVI